MSGQKLRPLPAGPWRVHEENYPAGKYSDGSGEYGEHTSIEVIAADGTQVVSFMRADPDLRAIAYAVASIPDLLDAGLSAINELRGLQMGVQLASLSAVTRGLIEHQAMKLEAALKKAGNVA